MPPDFKAKITCYSEEEGAFMRRSQELRGQLMNRHDELLLHLKQKFAWAKDRFMEWNPPNSLRP